MDLFSRKFIGWYDSDSLSTDGVTNAINKAKTNRKSCHPIIIHNDRGCLFVSIGDLEATPEIDFIHINTKKGTD